MFGLLKKKLKEGIKKISGKISQGKQAVRKKVTEKKISEGDIEDILWEFQLGLLESDVAPEVAEKICDDIKKSLVGKSVPRKSVERTVRSTVEKSIFEILDVGALDIVKSIRRKKPFLIVFLGFNGSGKTTTLAKIGKFLKDRGFSVVFAAADTFRAAAIQQLEEHGKRLGIKVIKQNYGSDPAAVVYDAVEHAKARGIDVVLADTAGRSHVNSNLMEELKKIVRVNKPDIKILVLDSLSGNDVVEQARLFDEAVGVDALVFTKMDVYDKGGALLSAVFVSRKPVLFIGTGQGYGDLESFDPKKTVSALLE
ncbi:MAG: signal recognition particle-docking protein FtsY [Candidatus Micrarchaeota archaeon]|nr:signal recognition particle-docking protein FtsY [Candidatus Micrarchaeota archaeon]